MSEVLVLPTQDPDLMLRQLATEADDTAVFEAVNFDPDHLGQFGDNTAEKYQTIEAVTAARLNAGEVTRMGMWDGETFVGFVKATPDIEEDQAEIGYWVDSRHTGHGYAALGARALARHMSQRFSRIFAEVVDGNTASARSLENAGFYRTAQKAGKIIFDFANTESSTS